MLHIAVVEDEEEFILQIKEFIDRYQAVSYTHLDVYKRQALSWRRIS